MITHTKIQEVLNYPRFHTAFKLQYGRSILYNKISEKKKYRGYFSIS